MASKVAIPTIVIENADGDTRYCLDHDSYNYTKTKRLRRPKKSSIQRRALAMSSKAGQMRTLSPFDPLKNVKVKVQQAVDDSVSRPSAGENSPGRMHIPIEVELSDNLLHKLLQQSSEKREQLQSIHRIADQRLHQNKPTVETSDDSTDTETKTNRFHLSISAPSHGFSDKHSRRQQVLGKIEKVLKSIDNNVNYEVPGVWGPETKSQKSQTTIPTSTSQTRIPISTSQRVHKSTLPLPKWSNTANTVPAALNRAKSYRRTARSLPSRKQVTDGSVRENNPYDDDGDYYTPRHDDYYIDPSRYESSYNDILDESYDVPLPRPEPKRLNKRGKLVTFYKSGDKHYKGLKISVNQKQFVAFEALVDFLSSKIPTTIGVKTVYSWPSGKQVFEVRDFQIGENYVCSETNRLDRSINYGEIKASVWHNKKMSAVKFRRDENELLQYTRDPQPINTNVKPRILTIISNVDRTSKEKVMLNPQTNQTFEEILHDIGNMVYIESPPVTGLFTAKRPHKKVFSFSQLFKDFKDHEVFLAVGRELLPVDKNHRDIPQSTQSDSAINFKPMAKAKPGRRFQKLKDYDSDYDELPPRSNLSVPNDRPSIFSRVKPPTLYRPNPKPPLSPKSNGVGNFRGRNRRSDKELNAIRIDIHNQRRGSLGESREFYSPSNYKPNDGKKPDKKLQLEWVYGYRGRDARSNLYVLPSGEMIYYVASVVVLYDRKKDRQRHYLGHNEDITSMVLHPNQFCVATGQASGTKLQDTAAHIRVWDARSLVTYAILGFGVFQVAVGCLAFSIESDGQYLMAIDESEKHTLSVWAWQEESVVTKTTLVSDADFRLFGTSADTVVWGAFHPFDDRIIVTYGKQHIYFWKIFQDGSSPTRLLRDKLSGLFLGEVPKFVTSVCFTPEGGVLSGDSNGNITLWDQDTSGAFIASRRPTASMRQAHRKSVFCLHMFPDGTLISGGGHEIKKWDMQYKCREVKKLPESLGFVRTLCPQDEDSADSRLYVGSTKNCILEGSLDEKFKPVVLGHSEELWALSTHPAEHTFVTAGYDQSVCKWSAVSHKVLWKTTVDKPCLSVCHNETGSILVIGTTEGRFIVLDGRNGSHLATIQVGNGAVDSTKFSPDGRLLAMGAQDGNIYIYDVVDNGQYFRKHKEGVLRGHKNCIMQIDWSDDSEYIQSVSGDYDLMFWNIYEMRREKSPVVTRDITWSSQSCVLGYSTAGVWTHLEDEEDDINVVCKSSYEDYLAVGDNQGSLRLFKYPASTSKPDFYEKKLYSSHVTNVKFLFDDSYLLSAGGIDAGLMQWQLIDSRTPR